MELPNVPISAEHLLNEYHERLANLTAANIRLTVMVGSVLAQRDNAIRRAVELEAQLRGGESAQTEAIHIGHPPGV
jgi:hypothetical protein